MNDIGDKNKAVYKLKGLPHIYCINLDDKVDRWESMESQFKYWEIENYTRVSAYDGREDDLGGILKGRYPDNMNSGEVGCSWKDFFCKVPYDYDVVQLAIINPAQVNVKMHRRFVNDFSTACYLISRRYAQKLLDLHTRGEKYKLDNGVKPRAVADDLIYNSGNTFAIPLFLYKIELGSDIHDIHVDVFHKSSYEGLWNFWKNDASSIEDWDGLFDYDPYFGTLPPGWEGK